MKKLLKKELPVLLFCSLCGGISTAQAELIGYDLLNGDLNASLGLTYYQNSAAGQFSSAQDAFAKYQSSFGSTNNVPDGLIDLSGQGVLDNFGLVMPAPDYAFFGISDTLNSSNPSGDAEAEWGFNIANYNNLSVDIDFAAMGDFEASDTYSLTYAIDDGPFSTLFAFNAETSQALNYTMVNGNQRMLNDPISIRSANSPFSFNLTNNFSQYSSYIAGEGSTLRLRMQANADGGTEGFGFSNIRINGTGLLTSTPDLPDNPTTSVSEPGTLLIMSLSLLGFARRLRC